MSGPGKVTLAALLAILKPDELIFIAHSLGPHECEAVAEGTVAELRASRCVEVCGDNLVERASIDPEGWLDSPTATLFIMIGGKAGNS